MRIRSGLEKFRQDPIGRLMRGLQVCLDFAVDLVVTAVKSVIKTFHSLWRNLESVAILTLAGLGTAHFIGEIAIEHAALSFLLVAEMLSPVVAVALIWVLIVIAQQRRKYRLSHAA